MLKTLRRSQDRLSMHLQNKLIKAVVGSLFFSSVLSWPSSVFADENQSWLDVIITRNLLKTEYDSLTNLPEDFKNTYIEEIQQKSTLLKDIQIVIDTKAGRTKTVLMIPESLSKNPFHQKFDNDWKAFVKKLSILSVQKCGDLPSTICDLSIMPQISAPNKQPGPNKVAEEKPATPTTQKHLNGDRFLLLSHLANENWSEALRTATALNEQDPFYRLVYDSIQRVYSFKHRGAGKVAIKGL